jgi:hypothetical protein
MNNGEFGELGMIPNHLKQNLLPIFGIIIIHSNIKVLILINHQIKGDTFQFEIKADNYILAKVNFLTNFLH